MAGEILLLAGIAESDDQKFGRAGGRLTAFEKIHSVFLTFIRTLPKEERPRVILYSEFYVERKFLRVCHVKLDERLI